MTPKEKAQQGLLLLKDAVADYLLKNPAGVQNSQVAHDLELESDFEGKHKGWLSWSLLGILIGERRVRYETRAGRKIYFPRQK